MARVVVYGAGAIGGITAAKLARAGVDVLAVDEWPDRVDALKAGIAVEGEESFRQEVDAIGPDNLEGPLDLVLLAVKSGFTEPALEDIAGKLRDDSLVVSVQNGLNETMIAERVGEQRTVGCIVGFGATSAEPSRLEQTSPGGFRIGYLSGEEDERLRDLAQLMSQATATEVTDNVLGHLWAKLIINCVIAVAAVNGSTVGEMIAGGETHKRLAMKVAQEALHVAEATGVTVEKFEDAADPQLIDPKSPEEEQQAFQLLDAMGEMFGGIYPSILQDLERGKPTEIDHINGRVVAEARSVDVDTPVNEAVVATIHEYESGEAKPGPDRLRDLAEVAAAA